MDRAFGGKFKFEPFWKGNLLPSCKCALNFITLWSQSKRRLEGLDTWPPLENFDKNAEKHSHKKIQRRDDFLTILEANKPPTINEKILKNFKNYSNLRDGGRSINLEGASNNGILSTYGITGFAVIQVQGRTIDRRKMPQTTNSIGLFGLPAGCSWIP